MKYRGFRNNRGASLISVIIAMTVVAILGITIMYVAYSNFNMKIVDKKSKDNFYTAESVLEEVVANLQTKMSVEYEKAYSYVMSNYGNYASVADLEQNFKREFILNMVDILRQGIEKDADDNIITVGSETNYSLPYLRTLVKASYPGSWSIGTTTYDAVNGVSPLSNELKTLEDGLVLRNVKVVYTEGSYQNTITTDIKLSVPLLEFAMITSMPNISDYAYIADDGIVITDSSSLKLKGNAFSGIDANDTHKTAIDLRSGAKMDASDSATSLLVAGGNVNAIDGASLSTGVFTSFWANGITASGTGKDAKNSISLSGRTYVADDITLNGAENKLVIENQYYGYSSGIQSATNAAESSAIIINGKDTTIDLSKIDTLVIAGTAYVGTSSIKVTGKDNADVKTGDSIAVKSNQIAYLVPTECAGIKTNPMSYTQYQQLTGDWKNTALNSVIPSLNRSIASYGNNVSISEIYSPEQGGTVYLYLSFADYTNAATYFMDMYKSEGVTGEKLRSYVDNYVNSFTFNVKDNAEQVGLTRLVTNGNYLLPGTFDTASLSWTVDPTYTGAQNSTGSIYNELSGYASNYASLCSKLVTTITEEEAKHSVYDNLINDHHHDTKCPAGCSRAASKIDELFAAGALSDGATLVEAESDNGQYAVFTASSGSKAFIVNGNLNVTPSFVTANFADGEGHGVIVATGDVSVSADWNGIIICDGKLSITANDVDLKADEAAVGEVLRLHCVAANGNEYVVTNFFRGGENYSFSNSGSSADKTDVRNCVSYENWKSE